MKSLIKWLVFAIEIVLVVILISNQRKTIETASELGTKSNNWLALEVNNPNSLGRYKNGRFLSSEVLDCINKWSNEVPITVTTEKGTFSFPDTDTVNLVNSASDAYIGSDWVFNSQLTEEYPYEIHFTIKTVDGTINDPTAPMRQALATVIGGDASPNDSFSVLLSKFQSNSINRNDALSILNQQINQISESLRTLDAEILNVQFQITRLEESAEEAVSKSQEVVKKQKELETLLKAKETIEKEIQELQSEQEKVEEMLVLMEDIFQTYYKGASKP